MVWMLCDVIKIPCSLDRGRSGTGLSVGVTGEGCMFWILRGCFAYAVARIPK